MITFSKIGHFGRLGNQLFQFASTFGIANKLGYNVSFPIENCKEPSIEHFKDGITRNIYFDIPRVFDIPANLITSKVNNVTKYQIQEPYFHFCEDLFSIPDYSDIVGYYQSEKYFNHCENSLRDVLKFKEDIRIKAEKIFTKLNEQTVSIHVRVGDYAGLSDHHPICEPEYYQKAIQYFTDKNYYFLIFSDNISYSKDIFGESENILYIEGNEPEVDMCMMSMCDHNIIANSSFSWWAAWLNNKKDKIVVAPKKWFGSVYSFQNTNDLYCKEWKIA